MAKLVVGINDLATLHPDVAAEADGWDPSTVSAGSSKKLPWKCSKGHTWKTNPNERTHRTKTSCPYCGNKKVWTGFNDLQTLFPNIAKEADGWDPSTVLAGSNTPMSWKCKKGHKWEKSLAKRILGINCPYCSNYKVLPGSNDLKTLFPEIAKEADGWDPSAIVPGHTKKLSWKCSKNHKWNALVESRTRLNTGCPYCSNRKCWTGFNDLQTLFPNIAKEADGWDPSTVLAGSHSKKLWQCIKGHTWHAQVRSRASRNDSCPYCSNRKCWTGFNDLQTLFPNIAKEADGWDPSTVLAGSNKPMSWKCKKGHVWETKVYKRTGSNGTNCPYCSNQSSKPEMRVFAELQSIFKNIFSRKKIDQVEIDIYLSDHLLGIEYDGYYYHKNKDNLDYQKNKFINSKGISLIRFREKPLKKISPNDIYVENNQIRKKDLNTLLLIIQKESINLTSSVSKKIEGYIQNDHFLNESLFKKYIQNFPSPLPENSLQSKFPKIAEEWHQTKNYPLKPLNFTSGSHQKVWWQCQEFEEHTWEAVIKNRTLNGSGCPFCYKKRSRTCP